MVVHLLRSLHLMPRIIRICPHPSRYKQQPKPLVPMNWAMDCFAKWTLCDTNKYLSTNKILTTLQKG